MQAIIVTGTGEWSDDATEFTPDRVACKRAKRESNSADAAALECAEQAARYAELNAGSLRAIVTYAPVERDTMPAYYEDAQGNRIDLASGPENGALAYDGAQHRAMALASAGMLYGRFPAAAAALLGALIGAGEYDDIMS